MHWACDRGSYEIVSLLLEFERDAQIHAEVYFPSFLSPWATTTHDLRSGYQPGQYVENMDCREIISPLSIRSNSPSIWPVNQVMWKSYASYSATIGVRFYTWYAIYSEAIVGRILIPVGRMGKRYERRPLPSRSLSVISTTHLILVRHGRRFRFTMLAIQMKSWIL